MDNEETNKERLWREFKEDWIADAMDNGYTREQAETSFYKQGYKRD